MNGDGGDLWPMPKQLRRSRERLRVGSICLPSPSGDLDWLAALSGAARRRRISVFESPTSGAVAIRLLIDATTVGGPEGYRLSVDSREVRVVATGDVGLFRGLQTFVQWLELEATSVDPNLLDVPGVEIEDHPDFARRGVMLDVSRDRVPTMETLRDLVDQLSRWKINELQLYTEHTFAYPGHEEVWRNASPFTAEEIRALDLYCRRRAIELVPNQQSLGHFHRWLVHDRYRPLAECPEGFTTVFTPGGEPYSLCPTDPSALALIEELFDSLLPNFQSRTCNVGLDETFDLGHGRSAALAAERGTSRVYLEFVHAVHALLAARGVRMQFWGDVILSAPELIPELPRDAIALGWGYEADHPFAEETARFRNAGLDFYVCPGTSSWNSIAGRVENALSNLASAARCGRAAGALGYLITDWGDHGHWQPLPVSYPGLLAGTGFAWNVASADALDPNLCPREYEARLAALLDRSVFHDDAGVMARAWVDLGNTYRESEAVNRNGSALFRLLLFADRALPYPEVQGLTPSGLARAEAWAEAAATRLGASRSQRPDAGWIVDEGQWCADMLCFAARLGTARLRAGEGLPIGALEADLRGRLRKDVRALAERHRELWIHRSRPGGLRESIARFEKLAHLLAGTTAT